MGWSEQTLQRKSEEWQGIAAKYANYSLKGIAEVYSNLRLTKNEIEDQLRPINKDLQVVEALLAEKFAEEDVKSLKFENGHSVGVRFAQGFKIQDKDAFVTWLKANGLESELTVSSARCTSIAKNVFEETQQVPDGLVAGDPVPVVTYRTK